MSRTLASLLLLSLVASLQTVEGSTVYNNATGFSATNNPAGVWSYGYLSSGSSPNPTTFTLYTSSGTVSGSGGSIDYWNVSGGGLNPPEIFYNPNNNVVSYSTITMQPDQAAFHPGPTDQYSDYRFTAPQAGSYSLSVTFTGIDTHGTTTDVHVLSGGSSLYSSFINGYGATESFSTTLTLSTGALVDFAVGYGSNGNYFYDSTGIDATLTFNGSSVPEPAGPLLLAIGSLGLCWWGRHRPSSGRSTRRSVCVPS